MPGSQLQIAAQPTGRAVGQAGAAGPADGAGAAIPSMDAAAALAALGSSRRA